LATKSELAHFCVTFIDKNNIAHVICSCGAEQPCANIKTYHIFDKKSKSFVHLQLIEKSRYHFKMLRVRVMVNVNRIKNTISWKTEREFVLNYNFSDRSMTLFLDNEEIECDIDNLNKFFVGVVENDFYRVLDDQRMEELIRFAFNHLVSNEYAYRRDRWGYQRRVLVQRVPTVAKALIKFMSQHRTKAIEILHACGFNARTVDLVSGELDLNASKPHEIFNTPKYLVSLFKDLGSHLTKKTINSLRQLDSIFDGNTVKQLVQIASEEANGIPTLVGLTPNLLELRDLGYRDVRRLFLYLVREVKLSQGISDPIHAANLLHDYVRMMRDMELNYSKYSKSLKLHHDVAMMNHNVLLDAQTMQAFLDSVESYKHLEFHKKSEDLCILVPKSAKDIIDEGSSLNHCVASYVNDVVKNKCQILFLRHKKFPKQSLVTIEVRDHSIRQVRGQQNRRATNSEMSFVRMWADERNLVLACH